jgi:hypothetical protein
MEHETNQTPKLKTPIIQVVSESSLPISTVIFAILLTLKLLDKITMVWFWVITSIIWVPLRIILICLLFYGLSLGIIVLGIAVSEIPKRVTKTNNFFKRKK